MVKDATVSPQPTLFQRVLVDINVPSIKRNPPSKASKSKVFHLPSKALGKGTGFGLRAKPSTQKLSGGKSLLSMFETAHEKLKIDNPSPEHFYAFESEDSPTKPPTPPAPSESQGTTVLSTVRSLFSFIGLI